MIRVNNFKSIQQLLNHFNSELICIKHLEEIRWSSKVASPFDSTSKVYKCANNTYKCVNTNKKFNVKTRTLFENTKINLQTWFLAIYLITSHKKGISSVQLSIDLNVTQKTAWFMLHRIRNCYQIDETKQLFGEVEIDETYIGGKNKNRHQSKQIENTQGRSTKDKQPVMGMLQRNGDLIAKVVKDTSKDSLQHEIDKFIEDLTTIYTDEWNGYNGLEMIYNHLFVKHNAKEYVNGKIHTNNIEGFWTILKRGIIGIYHFISKKHLQKYIDEFVFRFNTKTENSNDRFDGMLSKLQFRLTYKQLINK